MNQMPHGGTIETVSAFGSDNPPGRFLSFGKERAVEIPASLRTAAESLKSALDENLVQVVAESLITPTQI